MVQHVPQLVAGKWVDGSTAVTSIDIATGAEIASAPAASWTLIDRAVDAGVRAHEQLRRMGTAAVADFLDDLADRLDRRASDLVDVAHRETGLPARPRLADVELPRTTGQLRQAAAAARDRSWTRPTISAAANVRSMLTPLPGPVVTIGPSNFPFAFSSLTGGDAAAAWATGHPVIAKAHPVHVLTSSLLADTVMAAARAGGLPDATLQVLYAVDPADGLRLVADRRVAATAFTGSRPTGLALKRAADEAGVPIYVEMSSVNPIVVLPGAAAHQGAEIAAEIVSSVTGGAGQFCTKPGLVFVDDAAGRDLVDALAELVAGDAGGVMMTEQLAATFGDSVDHLIEAGATPLASGAAPAGRGSVGARLLGVDGSTFRARAGVLQTEAFGPATVAVRCANVDEIVDCLAMVEGSLAAAVYVSEADHDDAHRVVDALAHRVGRIAVNRPPTGVQVVPAMNHGGPYPSTGHPGFTAVGLPRSMERFAKLTSFDGVPDDHLPAELQDANPLRLWRIVDGQPTRNPLTDQSRTDPTSVE